MAKNTIADLDTTASNNTDVLNQSTQGTAAVSTIDTMIQNSLALLARFYADLGGLGTVGGTADAITLTTASTYQTLENGITLSFKAGSAITGASTINVDGLGVKDIRRIGDSATQAGDIVANGVYLLRYDAAYNSAAGAWILLNAAGASAATTSAAGIVELATAAEALTGTDATRAVTPAGLYFPTGHLYGLTLSNNGSDATNDIDIAAGTARDASDTVNMVLASALTKRLDASWAVGTGNGGLDTGSIADTTYHVWLIKRSDTGVVDALFSTSATSPTMPSDYDYKLLIGYLVRASSTNGIPTMRNRQPATELTGTAPVFACRAWVNFNGTGTVAIRASGNVSSITDNNTGDYTINFATALPDANYTATALGGTGAAATRYATAPIATPTASAYRVYVSDGVSATDVAYVQLAFFR